MKTDFERLAATYHLTGKRVAVLATDGFEQSELEVPVEALRACGAEVHIIAPDAGSIRGWSEKNWREERQMTKVLGDAAAGDYDSLGLRGGCRAHKGIGVFTRNRSTSSLI